MRERIGKFLTVHWVAAIIAVTSLLALTAGAATKGGPQAQLISAAGTAPVAAQGAAPGYADLVEKLSPAVVNIRVTKVEKMNLSGPEGEDPGSFGPFFERFFGKGWQGRPMPQRGAGSGFIISRDGYVVTNNHVVEGAREIVVKLAGEEEFPATVVGRDPKTDLALLKVKAGKDLPAVALGDSEALRVGDVVVAIGNPFGLSNTVTAGLVSAKGRVIGAGPYDDFIQTDASINPGNSGGPLFNLKGEVVGINTAIMAEGHGIGFAIPVNTAKLVVPELKVSGRVTRSWLGVSVQEVTPDLAKTIGLTEPHGALVAEVMADSPATHAGIKPGDVIVAVDGKPVKSSHDLPRLVAATRPGTAVDIKVLREGKDMSVRATLSTQDDKELAGRPGDSAATRGKLGMAIQDITPQMAQSLGLKEARGVVVSQVEPGSPADEAGIRAGDVILEVNRNKVRNVRETQAALEKGGSDRGALFLVKRGDSQLFIATKIG
jgi:serine protease Do